MANIANPFLAQVMRTIRHGRPLLSIAVPYFNRIEQVRSGKYAEVWFMTEGCSWDHQGGCTMCNYGQGRAFSTTETIQIVKRALSELPADVSELMVSPSGGFFDEQEVPPATRDGILDLVRATGCGTFLVETRSETVTVDSINQLVQKVPNKRLAVEVGLESSASWIQRFCVNKGSDPLRFRRAAALTHEHGVALYANVCLGTAFLSEAEAIDDAARSVAWALSNGASTAVLFPIHVKPYTLLSALYRKGRYKPVSLWSLAAVLERLSQLDSGYLARTEIAWYKSYYTDLTKIIASPTTCSRCYGDVIQLLDRFRSRQDIASVEALVRYQCACKRAWNVLLEQKLPALSGRVLAEYERLASDHGLESLWEEHKNEIARAMANDPAELEHV